MPRPNLSPKGAGAASAQKSLNPIQAWRAKREERIRQEQEEAARTITNDIAHNQNVIVELLGSIDFLRSRLPKAVLEAKSNPEQPYCDLEMYVIAARNKLLRDPQVIKMDIRKFDTNLLILVRLLKQAVEQGDAHAAYVAHIGVLRAIRDIRSRIPQVQPELATQFVELNAKYLSSWITLVGIAQEADRLQENVKHTSALYKKQQDARKESSHVLREQMRNDPKFNETFTAMLNKTLTEDRTQWTEIEREVFRRMVELRMEEVGAKFTAVLLHQNELVLKAKEGKIDTLHLKLANLPIVEDPNLMNQFQENINEMFEDMARADQEVDEYQKTLDDIEGRLKQLNNAPGAQRARAVVAEQAEKEYQNLLREQGTQEQKARTLGILDNAELAERKKQMEIELQMQMQEQVEEEREMLAN